LAFDILKEKNQDLPNYSGKLVVALGVVFLLLIVIVTATGSLLVLRNYKTESLRLGSTVTQVVSHSINEVSFSGKYHTRLLVEKLVKTNPELSYIIVVDNQGQIFAHSNPELNDKFAHDPGALTSKGLIGKDHYIMQELEIDGYPIIEFDVPFTGGYGDKLLGVVRVGISQSSSIKALQNSFKFILILVFLMIIVSLIAIFRISRHFSAPIDNMALTLKGIMDHSPIAIQSNRKLVYNKTTIAIMG